MTTQQAVHVDRLGFQDQVDRALHRHPAVGFAVAVVRDGELELSACHGVADVATRRPMTLDTVVRVASITKTMTAVAVLQLVERGVLGLDDPVQDHLRAYRLVPADPDGATPTVRQLLTHTGGISEQVPASGVLRPDYGESVAPGRPVPTLAEHYRGALPVAAAPGTRFRYGDHGIATLGQVVEDITRQPLARYLEEHVLAPLGMTSTTLVRGEVDPGRLASGYRLGPRGPAAVPGREPVQVGAGAAFSTMRDMARYAAALAGGGTNAHGTVLQPRTVGAMVAPQYRPDPRVPGIGLTFFRAGDAEHPLVEHQGTLPGFDSQLWVAPEQRVGLVAVTNGSRGAAFWLPDETGGLLRTLLGMPDVGVRTDLPQRPEVWGQLCGRYALPGPPTLADVRLRAVVGGGVEVVVRRGRLVLRSWTPVPLLARGFELVPDDPADPFVLRLDLSRFGSAGMRVVFGRASADAPLGMHLDVMPLSVYARR